MDPNPTPHTPHHAPKTRILYLMVHLKLERILFAKSEVRVHWGFTGYAVDVSIPWNFIED